MPNSYIRPSRAMTRVAYAGTALVLLATACKDIVKVENPNNVVERQLADPVAASAIANGVEASVARATGAMLSPYSTSTDELTWVGSRDAWQQLDYGNITDPYNEFTDAAFFFVGEARWFGDEAIAKMRGFRATPKALRDQTALVRTYINTAHIYITIGDMFENFALSSRKVSAPPLGATGMVRLYDVAIGYLDSAQFIADSIAKGDPSTYGFQARAMRARARHARAVWTLLHPKGTTPASPLVSDARASADAAAALVMRPNDRYVLTLVADNVVGDLSLGLQVNQRQEMRLGEAYIIPSPNNKTIRSPIDGSIRLTDPITGLPDPVLRRTVVEFAGAGQFTPHVLASSREMYLILAEDALAKGDTLPGGQFAAQINALRQLDALPPYPDPVVQVGALALLRHERRVNLFLQGRRLNDVYRFGEKDPLWRAPYAAFTTPGSFFPITVSELQANLCILNPASCR
ncbi:MAG: hypothetical protein NVS1B4_16830 [Gemmatimonadaceae bacterium]